MEYTIQCRQLSKCRSFDHEKGTRRNCHRRRVGVSGKLIERHTLPTNTLGYPLLSGTYLTCGLDIGRRGYLPVHQAATENVIGCTSVGRQRNSRLNAATRTPTDNGRPAKVGYPATLPSAEEDATNRSFSRFLIRMREGQERRC